MTPVPRTHHPRSFHRTGEPAAVRGPGLDCLTSAAPLPPHQGHVHLPSSVPGFPVGRGGHSMASSIWGLTRDLAQRAGTAAIFVAQLPGAQTQRCSPGFALLGESDPEKRFLTAGSSEVF